MSCPFLRVLVSQVRQQSPPMHSLFFCLFFVFVFFQGACSNLLTMSDHMPMPRHADLKHRLKLQHSVWQTRAFNLRTQEKGNNRNTVFLVEKKTSGFAFLSNITWNRDGIFYFVGCGPTQVVPLLGCWGQLYRIHEIDSTVCPRSPEPPRIYRIQVALKPAVYIVGSADVPWSRRDAYLITKVMGVVGSLGTSRDRYEISWTSW